MSLTKADLMEATENMKDGREKALGDMVKKLFDESTLLMISRLNDDLMYYVIKHLIIDNFFVAYWKDIRVEKIIVKDDKYPGYRYKTVNHTPMIDEKMRNSYRNFIEELLQCTISYKGQSRTEVMEAIKALQNVTNTIMPQNATQQRIV